MRSSWKRFEIYCFRRFTTQNFIRQSNMVADIFEDFEPPKKFLAAPLVRNLIPVPTVVWMRYSFLLAQNSINSLRKLLCCFLVLCLQESDMLSVALFDKYVLFLLNQIDVSQLCPFFATLGEPAFVIGVVTIMWS